MSKPNPFDDDDLPGVDVAGAAKEKVLVVCPISGEMIEAEDDREIDRSIDAGINAINKLSVDEVIDMYIQLKASSKIADTLVGHIRRMLGEKVKRLPSDSNTRYISGDRRKAKITLPGLKFSGASLRKAWDAYPQFREELLKIASIDVRVKEYKIATKTAMEGERLKFVEAVVGAEEEPTAAPTVEVLS